MVYYRLCKIGLLYNKKIGGEMGINVELKEE
jgi:hypothetical protein